MENHVQCMKAVFAHVLEDYAFLFSDEGGKAPAQCQFERYIRASMGFRGPIVGELVIVAPETFANEVAANVLGMEMYDEDIHDAAPDAFKELLNITCGNLLTALGGTQAVFDLSIPVIDVLTDDQWRLQAKSAEQVFFLVEDHVVSLQLRVA